MNNAVLYAFYVYIIITLGLSIYYSYASRKEKEPAAKGVKTARMNICMGLMLAGIALNQWLGYDYSTSRLIVGVVFLLLGLFNLFAGLRNHKFYSSRKG